MNARSRARWLLVLALAACDDLDDGLVDPPEDRAPTLTGARYVWVERGWRGVQPLGQGAVELTWTLPERYDGEVFRVYAKQSARTGYLLAATVTSCSGAECHYRDLNVAPGESYDYYVAAVSGRSNREVGVSSARRVRVPAIALPQTPAQPTAVGLDGAVFLRWRSTGAERYRVFLEREGADSVFIEVGSTDGLGYLDLRAENGRRYGYRIAAVDTLGHVSARSELVTAVPRPDYRAELIYSLADSAAASGFRFVASDREDPIVAGTAPAAQWRLESVGGALSLVPLGTTRVTAGTFTTALTCGPADEPDCVSVDRAPAASAFGTGPVTVAAGNSYVFQVTDSAGRPHFGKVRVQGRAADARGRTVVVFDWAYQLLPNEPALTVTRR